jgi:MtN3 and saliva related transmembrane protein
VTTLIGLVAAAFTTGAWLPQLLRTWRTRSAEDLSWLYLATMAVGMGLWLGYGLMAGDVVVVCANTVTVVLLSTLVGLKARSHRVGLGVVEDLQPVP